MLLQTGAFTQGCNDAGLCTMGDFGFNGKSNSQKYKSELSYYFGLGEKQTLVNTIQLDQKISVFDDKGQIVLRLPFHYIFGKLDQTYGIGDVSLGLNYNYLQEKDLVASFFVGGKFPTNDANKTKDGKGLPMVYQTSLGTYDLMLGLNLIYKKWNLGLGYQKPFGRNENTYLRSDWTSENDANNYYESYNLKRGDDLLLRINRIYVSKNKKTLYNTSLFSLYRLQKDQIKKNGQDVSLDNSDGLTLNANIGLTRFLENNDRISFSLSAPLITKEVRPDGLTRTLIFSITYAFGKKKEKVLKPVELNIQ